MAQREALKSAAQLDFTQGVAAKEKSRARVKTALWIFALLIQVLCGFFVAKIPVRPELAHVSAAFVVVFAIPCYCATIQWLGWQGGVRLLLALGVFALALESCAIVTGVPYGHFVYGEKIGARLFGIVPWTVPFAWTPLVCLAVALARRWTKSRALLIVFGGLILVAIDIVLDPPAVAQGFWKYAARGAFNFSFYDVPLQNFFGWFLTGSAAMFLVLQMAPRLRDEVPPAALIGSSLLILSFWTSVCFWMNLWLPAAMGLVLFVVAARVFFGEKR